MNAGIGLVPVLTAGAAALIPFQGTGPQKFVEVHFQVGVAMHVLKNKIVLALLLSVLAFMAACAGSSKDSGNTDESVETAAVRDAKVKAQVRSYLNGLVVFPTFFILSLNLTIRSS